MILSRDLSNLFIGHQTRNNFKNLKKTTENQKIKEPKTAYQTV